MTDVLSWKHDPLEKGRNLTNWNKSASDLSTFEAQDAEAASHYWKTGDDIACFDHYYFEDQDLSPIKKKDTAQEQGHLTKKSLPVYEAISDTIIPSSVNRGVSMSPKTKSFRGSSFTDTAGYTNKESRRKYNKKEAYAKPKGKMRKSEWRNLSTKITTLSPRQIEHLVSYRESFQTTLRKCSA